MCYSVVVQLTRAPRADDGLARGLGPNGWWYTPPVGRGTGLHVRRLAALRRVDGIGTSPDRCRPDWGVATNKAGPAIRTGKTPFAIAITP